MYVGKLLERLRAAAVRDGQAGEQLISIKDAERQIRDYLDSTFKSHHDFTGGD